MFAFDCCVLCMHISTSKGVLRTMSLFHVLSVFAIFQISFVMYCLLFSGTASSSFSSWHISLVSFLHLFSQRLYIIHTNCCIRFRAGRHDIFMHISKYLSYTCVIFI
ncbi:hypothetical protein F5050DRAFT_1109140 [Lentinula boryana]|uniref:Uncharacterized protein n=1 Tax=Lentinula boryana TaxID=40481 RepID=A0ABQ8QK99_9AGAR|nr:hypothetical protein F5050DRAFT_1109140 [Lentinula boryana]